MTNVQKSPRVAVLLARCGHLDGAEVCESVLALDPQGATVECIARYVAAVIRRAP
jgi:enhancing lycopene biosynthesis protein 2